ncbi:serine hydrolase domain-containing protein [Brachybacterium hainanense]|uniref:Serine hydrolase domain-containing protein n=1 Tax=Brachybacterium hainanense TaxID=1541174 RepID=A0ABV6R6E0_9MICO
MPADPRPTIAPIDREAVASVAAILPHWLETLIASRGLTGVQAAIWHEGALVAEVAAGTADESAGTALLTTHRLRIASHSKMFCALAVLRLAEQDRLRLDDTLGTHVGELADSPVANRTLRDLLSHSAGLTRDSSDSGWWALRFPFPDREQLIEIARTSAVVAEPGLHLQYSNIGYGLLGLVIESVTGAGFADAVHELVLDPVGAEGIGPDLPDDATGPEDPHGFALGHSTRLHGARRTVEQIPTHALAAATGFWASAGPIATFAGKVLADDALLDPASLRQMRRRVWTLAEGTGYGLGLQEANLHGFAAIGHSGGFPTGLTRTWVVPAARLAVSVLGTSYDAPTSDIAAGLLGLLSLASGSPAGKAATYEEAGALGGASNGRPRPQPLAEQAPVLIAGTERTAAEVAALVAGSYDSLGARSRLAVLGGRLFLLADEDLDPSESALELAVGTARDEEDAVTLELPTWGDSGYGSWAEPALLRLEHRDGSLRPVALRVTGQLQVPTADFLVPAQRIRVPR